MTPEEFLKTLIYRDAMMLVINKPAGIPVHKGFGGGENLEDYFEDLRFGLPRKPSLAHRLDKDTSGCLILGRHREALKRLSNSFANNHIKKTYWAIVKGNPPEEEGRIEIPLVKKDLSKHRWHMKAGSGEKEAQDAVTDYKVIKQFDGLSWLELKPQTGRTHQLRVHCKEMGCPILGDKIYGVSSPLEGEPKSANTSSVRFGGGRSYNNNLIPRAQNLRRELTPWETKLWCKINGEQLGYKFRRQQEVGNYIADFINFEKNIIIELDGSQHAENHVYDKERDQYLLECGYRVLRFWNNEIGENLNGVLEKIKMELSISPHRIATLSGSPSRGELMLHAREVEVPLYNKKPNITVTAEPPPHILDYIGKLM